MYTFGVPVTDGQKHWRMIVAAEDVAKAIETARDWCGTKLRVTAGGTVEWVGFIS
jgi:hypothetical protein